MTKDRQQRKQEEIRNRILSVAREIVAREGIQGLSVRKITNAIEYSPAIIYHYFKDKNEIVETLVGEGYRKIVAAASCFEPNDNEPEREIIQALRNYIKAALSFPDEYKAFLLSDDQALLKKTAVLEQGIAQKSPTFKILHQTIQRGILHGRFSQRNPELTAQIIWTATFGLVLKLMIEKDLPQEQVNRLIDHHFTILFEGVMARSPD